MNNVNYDKKQQEIINSLKSNSEKPTLLLHSCCAPCSTSCLERLYPYFKIDILYYNPNINDAEEYYKRLTEQKRFILERYSGSINVLETTYSPNDFLAAIKGYENEKEGGKRCRICYELRLKETAIYAKENGYNYFTTTLSVSPYKNAKWLNEIGESLEKLYGVKYLYADFKKGGGYLRSTELSKEYNLFRQDYCGCDFSKRK